MPAWCDELVQWDDELKRETDHITLGLVEPWPETLELPEGVELLTLRTHLRMGQDALVAARQALSGLQYAFATFAGCEAFRSIPEFAEAVAEILQGTPAVKLYHNRNPISDLLELFPHAQRIVLNHDLSDSEEIFLCSREEGVEPHPLTHLEGNLGDHEDSGLALYGETVNDLLACCPNVQYLTADILPTLDAAQENEDLRATIGKQLVLVLGGHVYGQDSRIQSFTPATADHVKSAAEWCPDAALVYLAADSPDTLHALTDFSGPSKLAVTFESDTTEFCPFSSVVPALKKFDLCALSLKNFKDVELQKVAKTGEKTLRLLSLDHCHVLDEEVKSSAFRNLVALRVTWATPLTLQSLLCECPELEYLKLGSSEVSRMFLSRGFSKTSLTSLKNVELRLEHPLEHHGLNEEDLVDLLQSLPSLSYVATNSAEIRLFLKSNASNVRIGILSCSLCCAEISRRTGRCSVSSIV